MLAVERAFTAEKVATFSRLHNRVLCASLRASRTATVRRIIMRNWSNEEIQRYLGTHRSCYLTHAKDAGIRGEAASGGTTSALAIALLERGLVDGVLVWRMVCDHPDPVCEPFIATNTLSFASKSESCVCTRALKSTKK